MILIKDTFYENEIADVAVTENEIYKVHKGVDDPDFVVDGTDTILLRGACDVHAHFRTPGYEYKEDLYSGYRAAIAGGFSAVCCEPNTSPIMDTTELVTEFYDTAKNISPLLFTKAAVTVGEEGEILTYLKGLYQAGCVMFSDDGEPIVDEDLLMEALRKTVTISITNPPTITAHCEETPKSARRVRNVIGNSCDKFDTEVEIIRNNIRALYRANGGRLHVQHVSKKESIGLIKEAKKIGLKITAEVTPHHLLFCDEDFDRTNANFKINPPIRTREDMMAVREALENGVIDMVATDHAPHSISEKMKDWENSPFGAMGIQTAMSAVYGLVLSGELSLERFIAAFTTAPQSLLPLEIRDKVKNSATLLNKKKTWKLDLKTNHSNSINSPFWGQEFSAKPTTVIINGKFFMREETILF